MRKQIDLYSCQSQYPYMPVQKRMRRSNRTRRNISGGATRHIKQTSLDYLEKGLIHGPLADGMFRKFNF